MSGVPEGDVDQYLPEGMPGVCGYRYCSPGPRATTSPPCVPNVTLMFVDCPTEVRSGRSMWETEQVENKGNC
jgi:hypothetical protein